MVKSNKIKILLFIFGFILVNINLFNLSLANNTRKGWDNTYSNMHTPRGHLTSQVYNNKIYAIGGIGDSDEVFGTLEIYDIANDSWSTGAEMITPRFSMTSELFEDKIYVIGGNTSLEEPSRKVEIYDIKNNTWYQGADMPEGYDSDYLSSIIYYGKIYCITTTNVLMYDIKSNSWHIFSTIPTPRTAMECEIYNGKIYCIGGFNSGNRVKTVEIYDIKTDSWSNGSDMISAKNVFASELYGGKIYTIGGYNNGVLNKVEIYDINSNSWRTGDDMITARAELETVRVDNKIYAFGGMDSTWSKTGVLEVLTLDILEIEQKAIDAVEKAEATNLYIDIDVARNLVNSLNESSIKTSLQDRLNEIFMDITISKKTSSSNIDVYIKSQNMLLVTLSTNNITFEDFSGISDMEKLNAITLTVSSSLPYDIKSYLANEILNSDGTKKMDTKIFNIKANNTDDYKYFTELSKGITLFNDEPSGNNKEHNIDLMLKGGLSYEKDNYKTVIKFEVTQK